jgi:hypothetical protein
MTPIASMKAYSSLSPWAVPWAQRGGADGASVRYGTAGSAHMQHPRARYTRPMLHPSGGKPPKELCSHLHGD